MTRISSRRRGLPLHSFLFLLTLPLRAAESGSLSQQAQSAWEQRDQSGQTERAIQLWQKAVEQEPDQGDLWIHLTQACGRAVRHAATAGDRKRWADKAREYGAKAVAKNPQSSDAYAAYGEALGQWANAHKGIYSLSSVKKAVDALKKAVMLNPKNAYAHMLLASFYREAPSLLSVGDKQKALEEAKQAVVDGPEHAINHLVLAKVYLDLGKKTDAVTELQIIIQLTPPTDAIPETRADKETASIMLSSLGVTQSPATACGDAGEACTEQSSHP
jgi:tetratricopeptide (TPR) repeat protein